MYENMPHSPYFRSVFKASGKEKNAVVFLCGLGVHELRINGQRVGDRWYAPAISQYDRRAGYIEYDILPYLRPGKNVLTVQLGSGFYNSCNHWIYTVNFSAWRGTPRLICDVELDGTVVESSGVHWKIHPSPVTFDCHHEGEDYDARLEIPECFQPDYDDSDWANAFRTVPPGGIIERDESDPCRVIRRFFPVRVLEPAANCRVFDFGINVSGVVEISVRGKRGSVVTIRYGEMLDGENRVDTRNVDACQAGARFETDRYTLKGEGVETWHPRFVWHGFQYAEVTCSEVETRIDRIESLFISSDLEQRGSFHSSHPVLNRLQEITLTSYRSNFMGIPTDCPTREKFGWTGDASTAQETGWLNYAPLRGL